MKCPKTMIRQKLGNFLTDEDGAVTVDFVVLTAGAIAMAIGIYSQFGSSEDEIYSVDASHSEVDYVLLYMMETDGVIDAPKRSFIDKITRTIRVKTILFQACLGFGITLNGSVVGKDVDYEQYCSYL